MDSNKEKKLQKEIEKKQKEINEKFNKSKDIDPKKCTIALIEGILSGLYIAMDANHRRMYKRGLWKIRVYYTS